MPLKIQAMKQMFFMVPFVTITVKILNLKTTKILYNHRLKYNVIDEDRNQCM